MRRMVVALALLVGVTGSFPAGALAQSVNGALVTGAGGSDAAMAADIAGLAAACGVGLTVRETAGGVESMQAVRDRRATQLGIVQSDVLDYFQTFQSDDPALQRAVRGMRIAFPLNESAVHVLARADVADLAGLAGRRVVTGPEGSGTRVTGDLVLDLSGVAPAERLPLGPAAAVDALVAGDVDAMVYVSGVPGGLLADPRLREGFHLLPLDAPALLAAYQPAEIPAGAYGFVTAPVPVVKVRSMLVTYDFAPARNSYQAASCRLVADVGHLILTRLDTLRQGGDPAWRSVDPVDLPAGWQVSGCVLQGLDAGYPFVCRHPDGSETSEAAADGDDAGLFRARVCARIGC